jgi:two-component system OmpR family sensor kinase
MAFRDFLRREATPPAANRHVSAISPRSRRPKPATTGEQLEAARDEILRLREQQREYEIQVSVLRQAVEARDRFLSIAAHELRNPMASISLGVTNLRFQAGRVEELPVWLRERLDALERQTRHFVRRSTMLLDVNRLAMGQLRVERSRVDLGAVARRAVQDVAAESERAHCQLRLNVDDGVVGQWDATALEHVAANFLSNAVKFGAGHPIDVYVRRQRGVAVLAVRDRGPGIAELDRARVFDPFERAVGAGDVSGFGLGLWMSRQLVRAHGGEIMVESEPGVGSVFTATFPLAAPSPEASHSHQ